MGDWKTSAEIANSVQLCHEEVLLKEHPSDCWKNGPQTHADAAFTYRPTTAGTFRGEKPGKKTALIVESKPLSVTLLSPGLDPKQKLERKHFTTTNESEFRTALDFSAEEAEQEYSRNCDVIEQKLERTRSSLTTSNPIDVTRFAGCSEYMNYFAASNLEGPLAEKAVTIDFDYKFRKPKAEEGSKPKTTASNDKEKNLTPVKAPKAVKTAFKPSSSDFSPENVTETVSFPQREQVFDFSSVAVAAQPPALFRPTTQSHFCAKT